MAPRTKGVVLNVRIFLQELRKIWRPAPILAALAVMLLFGQTSIDYYLHTLPEESEHKYALQIYEGWREKYGKTLDPDELPEVRRQLDLLTEDANRLIQNWDSSKNPAWASFSDAGVTNYAEYCALLERTELDPTENEVAALLLDSRSAFLHFQIQMVRSMLEQYEFERNADFSDSAELTAPEIARCVEIASDPALMHSVFYGYSVQAANRFAVQADLICLLTVMLLISPGLVRDRLARMTQEQWSARVGRRVLRYQLAAALGSAAAVSAAVIAVLGWKFCAAWRAGVFWDCAAYSVGGGPIPWFTLTFGQYLLLLGVVLVCLGIAGGALAFFLSRFSGNYIAMLLKALPLFLVLAYLAGRILSGMLYFGNALTDWTGVPGTELFTVAGLLLGALLLCAVTTRRELRRELV